MTTYTTSHADAQRARHHADLADLIEDLNRSLRCTNFTATMPDSDLEDAYVLRIDIELSDRTLLRNVPREVVGALRALVGRVELWAGRNGRRA